MYSRLIEMEISRRIIKMSLRFQKWWWGGCEEDSWAEWWRCPGAWELGLGHPQRPWCCRDAVVSVLGVTQRGNHGRAWRLPAGTGRCPCCKLWLLTDKGAETWHKASTEKRCNCEDVVQIWLGYPCVLGCLCVLGGLLSLGIVEPWLETKARLNCGHLNPVTLRVVFWD